MTDIQNGLDIENICDLVTKEILGRYLTKKPTEEQAKKYKRYGSEWFKDDIYLYAHDIITPIIMYCRVPTPKSIEFRSKLGFSIE